MLYLNFYSTVQKSETTLKLFCFLTNQPISVCCSFFHVRKKVTKTQLTKSYSEASAAIYNIKFFSIYCVHSLPLLQLPVFSRAAFRFFRKSAGIFFLHNCFFPILSNRFLTATHEKCLLSVSVD